MSDNSLVEHSHVTAVSMEDVIATLRKYPKQHLEGRRDLVRILAYRAWHELEIS